MSKKSFSTTNQNIVFIDASKKNNQNNDCENSNFQISPNCPNFNVKNNDDIGVGENIFTQKNYSEFSENRDDDSFNIDKFNNIIPNSFCDNSNYNFLYNINFIGYMPFENKLKSNEAKESQEILNIKKISEMEKEKQLIMKEKELIEKEKALNMKEKELREYEEKLRKEKELIEKERNALNMKEKELIEKETALNMKEKEMREKIEKELREKIEKELREKIEKELREKIEKELREKIQQEFREKEILKKEEKKEKKI